MPPTNMIESIIGGLIGLILTIIGWIVNKHANDLEKIKSDYVSKEHLDSIIAELKSDRKEQNVENLATLTRIESKIDINEARAAQTRHDTLETVHQLSIRVALLGAKLP